MDQVVAVVTVAAIVIVPFFVLALAAIRFGVDSRPGIDERDQPTVAGRALTHDDSSAGERPRLSHRGRFVLPVVCHGSVGRWLPQLRLVAAP